MSKSISITLAACVALTGCQVFKKSETWDKVTKVKVDTHGSADPSKTYADQLHRELAASKVEHKVITYQYRYRTRLREEAVGQRTAVLYKDESHPDNPWYLKDEASNRPVWLPNADESKQVAFYIRRNAEVVESKDYAGEGKEIIAARPSAVTRIARVQKPAAQPQMVAQAKSSPVIAPRQPHFWEAPSQIVARALEAKPQMAAHPALASAHRTDWEQVFRSAHGTYFDPASSLDRDKMETLREALLHRNASADLRSF